MFCLTIGILYLWGPQTLNFSLFTFTCSFNWPHFMLLSFYLFVILVAAMAVISLTDRDATRYEIPAPIHEGWSRLAIGLWIALAVVMVSLYIYFN